MPEHAADLKENACAYNLELPEHYTDITSIFWMQNEPT